MSKRAYEGDTLEFHGKKWEVVFATSSPKCGRILLLKHGMVEWAIVTDNLDGTISELELMED